MNDELVASIRREIRSGRKADFLDVLHRYANKLKKIPLPLNDEVDTAQAFRDAVREDVSLNGIRFVGEHRMEAYIAAIKRIVAKFTPDRTRCLEIADRILKSCSRTSSGADSYFALQKLFGLDGILIKPRQEDDHDDDHHQDGLPPPPLEVKIGLDHDRLKCRISTVNVFGLYRHDDIERVFRFQQQQQQQTIECWIQIDTIVIESIDFSTNTSARYLTIRTPEPACQISSEVKELF